MKISTGVQEILKFCHRNLRGSNVGITDGNNFVFTYAVEMDSGAVIYVYRFIKIGSGIQMFIGGICRQQGDLKSLLSYFKK
jgi:hypothetical protein